MKRHHLNIGLLTLLFIGVVVNLSAITDFHRPNWLFIPEMFFSAAVEPFTKEAFILYSNSPFRTKAPISASEDQFPFPPDSTGRVKAGMSLVNPWLTDTLRGVERGEKVYTNYCSVCHGLSGIGDGPIIQRGFPAPPSLLSQNAISMLDGEMVHIITYGRNNMAPYASQIPLRDRWACVLYIRQLQRFFLAESTISHDTGVSLTGVRRNE